MFGDDYIGIYDNALNGEECRMILNRFESVDKDRHERSSRSCSAKDMVEMSKDSSYVPDTPDEDAKICTQINFSLNNRQDNFYHKLVESAIYKSFSKYKNRYPFLQHGTTCGKFHITSQYNLQKYEEGEGFYPLHCEHGSLGPYRMLVWMLYLNNAKSGTEFPTQKKVIRPKTGRMVIWPAGWTHPHKGVTPNRGLKYILTGWWNYEPKFEGGDVFLYDLDK